MKRPAARYPGKGTALACTENTPMKSYEVIIPDPWAFSRPKEKPKPESEHATREEAEARCREIVAEELRRRFEETGSWTQALRSYLDSRQVPYVAPEGEAVEDFSDFARSWVAERLAEDWAALMEQIIHTEPEAPRGWFRWLHHTPFSRYPASVDLALAEEWTAVGELAVSEPQRIDSLLILNVEAHAWEIGWLGLRPLAESCWERLSSRAKGLLLAGFSNQGGMSDWILARLPEAALPAEGVLEIACNAVGNSDLPLFQAALEKDPKLLSHEVERLEPFEGTPSRQGEWSRHLAHISDRVVDMALEACVVRGWAPGARLALQLGASPDLRVWVLERNYNEHHSALSYAIKQEAWDVADLLLEAGAGPSAAMGSKPLYLAIANRNDSLAERLIDSGMDFSHGDLPDWLAASSPGDNIAWERAMFFNCHRENIERAQRLAEGLPIVHPTETAWFYRGDGQGGRYGTFLGSLLFRDDARRLQWCLEKGLPLKLTLPDLAILLSWGAYDCLRAMMEHRNTLPAVIWRIRRELPDFGTGRRLWMVRPDARRVGVLPAFDPGNQTPLDLPDGSRLWVDLSGLAGADDQPGPVTPGMLWVRTCVVAARRRKDRVVLREASFVWELRPEPTNDHQLRNLLPVVKEVDGEFLLTGLTLGKVWWQDDPRSDEDKDWIQEWTEGAAWLRLRPQVIDRLNDQRAAHQLAPKPVLDADELAPFPAVFHPWLRRTGDGFVRLDETAAAAFPKIIADYRAWDAAERHRERDSIPDPRLLAWPPWNELPADLRPWFAWDEFLNRPRPLSLRHPSAYEKAMCRQALNWWNQWMIAGIRDAMEST